MTYDPKTGLVTRNQLGREHFKSDKAYRMHLTRDAGKTLGTKNKFGYLFASIAGTVYPLHRLAWVYMNGDIPEGMFVDHRNGIRDDNRWENIKELVTWSQNQRNSAIRKDNRTGYKGVSLLPSGRFWARVKNAEGVQVAIGSYDTAELAHAAVMDYNVKNFGKYARTGPTVKRRKS